MAGGFGNIPFEFNIKCVAFGGGLVVAYFTLPCRYDPYKHLTAGAIFTVAYVGMAHYDLAYNCNTRLKQQDGVFNALTGFLKPTSTCEVPEVKQDGSIQFVCRY